VSSRSGDGRLACKLLYPSLLLTYLLSECTVQCTGMLPRSGK